MTDLTYTTDGIWVRFIPQTDAGEKLWREAVLQDADGVFVVLFSQLNQTLALIKKAGYTVRKARAKAWSASDDSLLAELMA